MYVMSEAQTVLGMDTSNLRSKRLAAKGGFLPALVNRRKRMVILEIIPFCRMSRATRLCPQGYPRVQSSARIRGLP
jgi:hypothetical protein